MQTSEHIDKLAVALSKAQAVMATAEKSSLNPFFKSKYADLAEVWEACRKPLTDNDLSFIQSIHSEEKSQFEVKTQGKEGPKQVIWLWLTVTSRLLHSSEQWIEDTISMPVEADPQAIGKITTYIRRYALMALCGIAPEDDDGESASGHKPTDQAGEDTSKETIASYFCKEHKAVWFKKGNMKSFAHPIEGTKDWCYMPSQKPIGQPSETAKEATPGEKATNDTPEQAPVIKKEGMITPEQSTRIKGLLAQKGIKPEHFINKIRGAYNLKQGEQITVKQADVEIKSLESLEDVKE